MIKKQIKMKCKYKFRIKNSYTQYKNGKRHGRSFYSSSFGSFSIFRGERYLNGEPMWKLKERWNFYNFRIKKRKKC